MKIIPPYLRVYQQILKDLENAFPFLNVPKAKAGRKPKLTDIHIAAIFILSYITNTKVLTLAKQLIDPSIQSWHIFRSYRLKRVYRILREYKLHKLRLMILARLLYGEKIELVIDGTIVDIANVNRARTKKIWRARKASLYRREATDGAVEALLANRPISSKSSLFTLTISKV